MAGEQGSRRVLGERANIALLVIALVGLILGGAALIYNDSVGRRHAAWITIARQVQGDAQSASRIADDVSRGLLPDFAVLAGQRDNFDDSMQVLTKGDVDAGIAPMPSAVKGEVTAVQQAWDKMKGSMSKMLDAESAIEATQADLRMIDASAAELATVYSDGLAKLMQSSSAGGYLTGLAGQQLARTEKLQSLTRHVLGDGRDAKASIERIGEVTKALAAAHTQLAGDGPVGQGLKAGTPSVDQITEAGKRLVETEAVVNDLQVSAAVLPGDGRNLFSTAIALEDKLGTLAGSQTFVSKAIVPALVIAVLALVGYVILNILSVRRRIRRAEENDAKQQSAILGLLDEISNLADGDLTVRANVTADFTGAIADSINYTIETLRSLVGTINQTAVEISAAATSTAQTAETMKSASDEQAQEVVGITQQMTNSSDSLSTVAARAEQLAKNAADSVAVAHNGASTVGRTIQGMAALREQIQDTAKRIKRLGESSQEIGNIIEFINDIAEQTNTLALNASIQAAMAGESGRGFAVVADEVQRLAERAAAATRQIETLVKTIQADTNEAIVSMERSTTNVIAGARSAEEAGQALTKIESSSNELARMITDISGEARSEAAVATRIAGQMQAIREISVSTASSAQVTSTAVGELNSLSEKLRESVAGFKLPADVSLESGAMSAFTEPA